MKGGAYVNVLELLPINWICVEYHLYRNIHTTTGKTTAASSVGFADHNPDIYNFYQQFYILARWNILYHPTILERSIEIWNTEQYSHQWQLLYGG
jgi:hypothetical protein